LIEEILDGIIDRKRRLNRLVELQSKMVLSAQELRESIQAIRCRFSETESAIPRN
jgi:hypothetical protein